MNGTTNTTALSGNPVFNLGNIAVVTGSVAYASNAGSLNGVPGGAYLQTNGNGSALTGITASQVGALASNGLTASAIAAAGGLTNSSTTIFVVTDSTDSTNTLASPTNSVLTVYSKTNSANNLVLIYSTSTNTIAGTANVKCYPAATKWVLEW
jgi:hypothetical protein